jgi:hypothetical protein
MPALPSINVSGVVIGSSGAYNWQSNVKTVLPGATLRITNAPSLTLQITLTTSARNFTISPGGVLTVPIQAEDYGFTWRVMSLQQGSTQNVSLLVWYYDVGEDVEPAGELHTPNIGSQQRNVTVPIAPQVNGAGLSASVAANTIIKITPAILVGVVTVPTWIVIYLNNLSLSTGGGTGTWNEWAVLLVPQDSTSGADQATPIEVCRAFTGALGSPAFSYPNTPFSPWASFQFNPGIGISYQAALEIRYVGNSAGGSAAVAYGFSLSCDFTSGVAVPSVGQSFQGIPGTTF